MTRTVRSRPGWAYKKSPSTWAARWSWRSIYEEESWHNRLLLTAIRGQRTRSSVSMPKRYGGWYIGGFASAKVKWFVKRLTAKMRRREVKQMLRGQVE